MEIGPRLAALFFCRQTARFVPSSTSWTIIPPLTGGFTKSRFFRRLAGSKEAAARTERITWIIATRNEHKVAEIRGILGGQFEYLTLKHFPDAPPTVEDATDFAGNATKKAVQLANW